MFIDVEDYLSYLVKHKITPNQFLFLYIRHLRNTETLERYIDGVRAWKKEEIDDLVNRGFLDDVNSPGEDYSHAYFVTPKFDYELFTELEGAGGEELWNEYPPFFIVDGRRAPARTCDKEELEKTYVARIKNSKKKHERIIELVKKLKAENRISMGIEKFVKSEQWNCIWQAEKEGNKIADRKTSDTSNEL